MAWIRRVVQSDGGVAARHYALVSVVRNGDFLVHASCLVVAGGVRAQVSDGACHWRETAGLVDTGVLCASISVIAVKSVCTDHSAVAAGADVQSASVSVVTRIC